jgi:molecular chaperone DnaK
MTSETVLGIDFGTTNSVCSILTGGDPEILENSEGYRLTPSLVYYTKENEQNRPLVGLQAANKARDDPNRVVRSIKRKMGDEQTIEVAGTTHRVEEVAAEIIRKLRTDAADKLGVDRSELRKAVITTPEYWEGDRTKAVHQAAELAGFDSVRLIKEPASAAIAYGRFQPNLQKTVGVYDLGGGTFDFAIVDVDVSTGSPASDGFQSSNQEYSVIASAGNAQLGGDDWDQRIIDWIAKQFESRTGENPLEPYRTDDTPFEHEIREERIRSKARAAKEELSNRATTAVDITIPFLMTIGGESKDIETTLTQTEFESMTEDLLQETADPIYTALDDSGLSMHEIDEVLLVGGSTRMPQVKELVQSIFDQEPKQRVNPDEAVAAGAAVKGNRNDILLLEVTPLSLGIGIKGGRFKRMVERNTRLPAKATEVFTTAGDGDTAVRIPIYQGERDIASENRHLKTLLLQGMAPGSRNAAHIEVTFEVQKNGLISVRAIENTKNNSVGVKLTGENQLPDEYINEKIEEAEKMEELDRRRQKVIEAQNNAGRGIREAEQLLEEFSHIVEEDELDHFERHIANVRSTRSDSTATLGELKAATEDLDEWVLEIGDRVRRSDVKAKTVPTKGPSVEADTGTRGGSTTTTGHHGGTVSDMSDENSEGWDVDTETEAVTDMASTGVPSETVTATGTADQRGEGEFHDPNAFDTPDSVDTNGSDESDAPPSTDADAVGSDNEEQRGMYTGDVGGDEDLTADTDRQGGETDVEEVDGGVTGDPGLDADAGSVDEGDQADSSPKSSDSFVGGGIGDRSEEDEDPVIPADDDAGTDDRFRPAGSPGVEESEKDDEVGLTDEHTGANEADGSIGEGLNASSEPGGVPNDRDKGVLGGMDKTPDDVVTTEDSSDSSSSDSDDDSDESESEQADLDFSFK